MTSPLQNSGRIILVVVLSVALLLLWNFPLLVPFSQQAALSKDGNNIAIVTVEKNPFSRQFLCVRLTYVSKQPSPVLKESLTTEFCYFDVRRLKVVQGDKEVYVDLRFTDKIVTCCYNRSYKWKIDEL